MRIVVVDDNRDTADSIAMLLELYGHTVRAAVTAEDGLTLAREFRPHVVLMDIGLPDMDGYAAAARLRADPRTSATCLVAVTGYGRPVDRQRSHEARFDLHLTKPVDPDELIAFLGTLKPAPD